MHMKSRRVVRALGRLGFAASAVWLASASVEQQAEPLARPATQFEVAAIKPADPNVPNQQFMFGPGGTLKGRKLTLRFLIGQAYGLRESQTSGGPSWIDSEQFDVDAKADGDASGPEIWRGPLQKLLVDRFQLAFHKTSKEMTAFALVVAKGGPKFKETVDEERLRMRARGGGGEFSGPAVSMSLLVAVLSHSVERVIVDKTGLKGRYNVKLEWNDEPGPAGDTGDGPPGLFAALQQQLGLKLEKRRMSVEILTVESAQMPSAN